MGRKYMVIQRSTERKKQGITEQYRDWEERTGEYRDRRGKYMGVQRSTGLGEERT